MFEKKYDYVASLWRRVNRRGGDIGGGKEDGEEDQTVRPSEIYNCVFVFLKQRHLASVYQICFLHNSILMTRNTNLIPWNNEFYSPPYGDVVFVKLSVTLWRHSHMYCGYNSCTMAIVHVPWP